MNCTLESLTEPELVEVQWTKVAADLDRIARYVDESEEGGKQVFYAEEGGKVEPTYAAFVVCGGFLWLARGGPEVGGWDKVKTLNGGRWARLWLDCEPYMQE